MSLQDGKKSIWDDLPDEWKTETTQHDIQKSGADDAQPVYQPEFPSDDDSVPDEVNNASRSVNEETSELQDTFLIEEIVFNLRNIINWKFQALCEFFPISNCYESAIVELPSVSNIRKRIKEFFNFLSRVSN